MCSTLTVSWIPFDSRLPPSNLERLDVVSSSERSFKGAGSPNDVVLAMRASDDLQTNRHAVRREPRADRSCGVPGEIEGVRIVDPRNEISICESIRDILAHVQRGHRYSRGNQKVVPIEESTNVRSQRVPGKNLGVVIAHFLRQRGFKDIGHSRIQRPALMFDEGTKPNPDTGVDLRRPEIGGGRVK